MAALMIGGADKTYKTMATAVTLIKITLTLRARASGTRAQGISMRLVKTGCIRNAASEILIVP
jgi:hypothetical protein